MEFKELDPILHSQLRLAVVSLLISVREAEFTFLKEKTNSTATMIFNLRPVVLIATDRGD